MIRIDAEGNIQITRGDDEVITVDLIDMPGNTPHTASSGESLKMTVRSGEMLTDVGTRTKAFTKTANITQGSHSGSISILASDTRSLSPGRYVYDIELLKSSGGSVTSRTTVVGGDKTHLLEFYIVEDVTWENG